MLADLGLQVPGTADAAETGAGRVRFWTIVLRRNQPLQTLEREGSFDDLLPVGGPNGCDCGELAGRRVARVLHARTHVDHLGIAQRLEADTDHIDAGLLRAQEVDVAIAGDGYEAARDRSVFQRQFVDA